MCWGGWIEMGFEDPPKPNQAGIREFWDSVILGLWDSWIRMGGLQQMAASKLDF